MSEQYEVFCLANQFFYDTPDQRPAEQPDFEISARDVPTDWGRTVSDTWMYYVPADCALPEQGWKIHVSACLDDAERALDIVWEYCVPRSIAFKFLRNKPVMMMMNSKSAFRGSSGKLITIYPENVAQLELILKELEIRLDGVRGPYILSDLRYGESSLYVRYGGFSERYCLDVGGRRVLAVQDGTGALIPDVRGATFSVPPWISLPEFLEPHLRARNSVTVAELPYTIDNVLQFSNGGGVYLGTDKRTGERVVLKEGRPHAGLDLGGRDAVRRIKHERDILSRLAGLDVVPELRDYFVLGEHHFLVLEFVDGNPLQRKLVFRFPLTHADSDEGDLAEYTGWALEMTEKVERAVHAIHERGVVFGDLHPSNILVTEEGRLVLIDFEVASLIADDEPATLAHPAFQAPRDRRGADIDRYALACLRLGMFAPQTTILSGLNPGKTAQLATMIADTFPVPAQSMHAAAGTIVGDRAGLPEQEFASLPLPGVAPWPEVRDALGRAILASATPHRWDRLFPGDIAQFGPGGVVSIAHGAAGVLHALAAAGLPRVPEHEDWLRARTFARDNAAGIGFYDGLHGVAHVLHELGHPQAALDVVDGCLRMGDEQHRELNLYSGLAGVGLNLLHLGPEFAEHAARIVDQVADRLGEVADVPEISGGDHPRAGLLYGSSGPALLFLRAYEASGDTCLLDHAATALRQDLRRCVAAADGTLQVNQGWRMLPYLDEGSVGIALVLRRYLRHRADDELAARLTELTRVTRSDFFVQSCLFDGRAGILAALAGTDEPTDRLVRGLAWHAMPYGGGLAFPGRQLLRLSMDFASGTAGVLFGLTTALSDTPVRLPFLDLPDDSRKEV